MSRSYALCNGIILDGTVDMRPVSGRTLLIKDGKIQKILSEKGRFSGYQMVDLKGQYILPGMINLHVHLAGSGKPKKKAMDPVKAVKLVTGTALGRSIGRKMVAGYARQQLMSGVTTIRTVGGIMDFDAVTRDRITAGKLPGPRILAANMAVSVPGGHMAGSLGYEAHTPEEGAAYVRRIAETKADLIKLMITGGVLDAKVKGEPGVLKMQPEIIRAVCDQAHAVGLQTAAHVESPEGLKAALKNGVDTIEHGAEPDEEIIGLFKESGAALVTTISPALPFALFDRNISHATEMQKYNGEIVMKGIIDCSRRCLEAGIPVGLGTDTACPYVTQYDMWRELCYFSKYCGVSPAYAIHTASLKNAEIAGIADITGSIEEGKSADLLVVRDNPLEDLTALRDISMVMAEGRLYEQPKNARYAEVDRQLDPFLN